MTARTIAIRIAQLERRGKRRISPHMVFVRPDQDFFSEVAALRKAVENPDGPSLMVIPAPMDESEWVAHMAMRQQLEPP